jgi:hypothetical protein
MEREEFERADQPKEVELKECTEGLSLLNAQVEPFIPNCNLQSKSGPDYDRDQRRAPMDDICLAMCNGRSSTTTK